MKKELLIILFCIVLYFTISFYDSSKFSSGIVSNVIDGDTFELITGEKIRMYGINTPESDEYYYSEATYFVKEKIENKKIKYKRFGTDQYNRTLAIVYYENENVNLELVREGYAMVYFTYKDSRYTEFENAFNDCVKEQIGLCKSSLDSCAQCIKLKELNYDAVGDDRENVNGEYFILENQCDYNCNLNNWVVKDSTSKNRFILTNVTIQKESEVTFYSGNGQNTLNSYFLCNSKNCPSIWNNDFDVFYMRASDGGLVIYKPYYSND